MHAALMLSLLVLTYVSFPCGFALGVHCGLPRMAHTMALSA